MMVCMEQSRTKRNAVFRRERFGTGTRGVLVRGYLETDESTVIENGRSVMDV